jgi:hypothetical protein
LTWIYRSAHNAKILGGKNAKISPGLAVGSFFIPIYNMFGPMVAMWRVSQVFQRFVGGTSVIVALWWFGSFGVGILSVITENMVLPFQHAYIEIGRDCIQFMLTAIFVITLTRQQTELFLRPPVIDEPAPWKHGVAPMPAPWKPGVPPMRVRPSLPPRRPTQPD